MINKPSATEAPPRKRKTASKKSGGRLSRFEREEAEAILAEPVMDYMDDPTFHEPDAEKTLFDEVPELEAPNCDWYHPAMESLAEHRTVQASNSNTLLTAKQEVALFRQFNYARFRVATLQDELEDEPLRAANARLLIYWYHRVDQLRDQIVRFNLALVLAMAKRVSSANIDYMELISEGNMALLRAIDKFDASRGFKFSTYACRAILKAFSRLGMKQTRHRGLFPVAFDPAMEKPDPNQITGYDEESEYVDEVKSILKSNSAELSEVEREVIKQRFQIGSDAPDRRLTLTEVGKLVGYTKERVRQIQNRALEKLRASMEDRLGPEPFEA